MEQIFDLPTYLTESSRAMVRIALRSSFTNPRELLFLIRTAFSQRRASRARNAFERQGRHVPSFLIASITHRCNLFCTGCYARANQNCGDQAAAGQLDTGRWGELFREARGLGVIFILLAGGEPMLRRDVLEQAAGCKGVVFPVFTNGTLVDDEAVRLFHRNRNLVPILSLEGDRAETDGRRGSGTYDRLLSTMAALREKGIFFGVSLTVTKANLVTVSDERFIADLKIKGCRAVLFIEYVPVSADSAHLAPGEAERRFLSERQNTLRRTFGGMNLISFPGDEKYLGGCLAAGRGFFHINPDGGAEPCPFSPFSDTDLKTQGLLQALDSPLFQRLNREGLLLGEHTGGCLLFEKEQEVRRILAEDKN